MPARSPLQNRTASLSGFRRSVCILGLVLLTLPATPGEVTKLSARAAQAAAPSDPLIQAYPAPVEDAIRALKRGFDSYSAGQYKQALESLPNAGIPNGFLLADYAALWRGWARLKSDGAEEALRLFRFVRGRFPDSPLVKQAALGESEALLALKNPADALAVLDGPGIDIDAAVLYHRGLAEEASGHRQQAETWYLRVFCDYVGAEDASLALNRLQANSPGFLARPGNLRLLLQRAENLLQAGRNNDARALVIRLGRTRSPDAGTSMWRKVILADVEQRLGRTSRALGLLANISDADAEIQARAIYLRAVCHRSLKQEPELVRSRDLALRLHPQSTWTERLLHLVAAYYDVDNRPDQVEAAYGEISTRFPGGRYAERASWRLAMCAWTRLRYEDALNRFFRHMRSWPSAESASASAYWMGRCCEKLGDYSNALLLYQRTRGLANNSYYGRLAGEAAESVTQKGKGSAYTGLGYLLKESLGLLAGIKQAPVFVPQPTTAGIAAIERARQLLAAGLPEIALSELRTASTRRRQDRAIAYVAALIHARGGDYFSSIAALSRAFPEYALLPTSSIPKEVSGLLFPTPYLDLIRTGSTSNGLDPAIVLSLIRQESAFMTDARSRADARGLMQVLPATGRQLARQAGIRGYTTAKLFQPGTNVTLGTRQLSSLLELFAGKIELALAGYNAGLQRARRWQADFGEIDMAEFVERIPFTETRQYVKQVLTNSAHYRALLSQ